jgi:hypothetical protein
VSNDELYGSTTNIGAATRDAEFTEALRQALPSDALKGWFEVFTLDRIHRGIEGRALVLMDANTNLARLTLASAELFLIFKIRACSLKNQVCSMRVA